MLPLSAVRRSYLLKSRIIHEVFTVVAVYEAIVGLNRERMIFHVSCALAGDVGALQTQISSLDCATDLAAATLVYSV